MSRIKMMLAEKQKHYFKNVFEWNEPMIAHGMYPVNWNGRKWVRTTLEEWDYNYESVADNISNGSVDGNGKGKWANAVTKDGSIYVWIPRYSYKIVSGYHKSVKSWNSDLVDGTEEEIGKIQIKFSDGIKDNTLGGFIVHPAFTFGKNELTGFWVMKFTASRIDATIKTLGRIDIPSSRPKVLSWRNLTIGEAFEYAYKLNRRLDSHLMKNIEWGAVAYLTNAIGRIPYINNNPNFLTGMAAGSQDARENEDSYFWNTRIGVKASTTHNVYGVYDMCGGTWEYVAGYYGEPNPTYADALINAEGKYKDVYDKSYSEKNYGDAMFETSMGKEIVEDAWDNDFSYAPVFSFPFSIRGGHYEDKCIAGIFACYISDGNMNEWHGFRVTLSIKKN